MEVHAHTHTERKKWTHYLWEFLMLFLAVFCGYLAEYQLEHKIERDREKQFIRSLLNDVSADTVKLNNLVNVRNQRENWLDSLTYVMNSQNPGSFPPADVYYYAIFIPRSIPLRFIPNDGTIQQLKSAGGLRLINKLNVKDSIIGYDIGVRNLIRIGEVEETLINDYRGIAHYFFDGIVFDSMLDANNIPRRPKSAPQLYSFSDQNLHELNYKLFSIKAYNRASRRESKRLLQQAENLLSMLQKEYHLK
jgi:hypothetical protein